ncbi:MAG: hypothetical protein R3E89_17900 [Thiolinea sp.]
MKAIASVFRKEFNSFFASPAAWLFLGVFLVASLFIFSGRKLFLLATSLICDHCFSGCRFC